MGYCKKKAQTYEGGDNNCRLCLEEKWCILEHVKNKMLNKSEVIFKWRYVNIFHLCHLPPFAAKLHCLFSSISEY